MAKYRGNGYAYPARASGGDYPWLSYSPYYAASIESLYLAAERDDIAINRAIEPERDRG